MLNLNHLQEIDMRMRLWCIICKSVEDVDVEDVKLLQEDHTFILRYEFTCTNCEKKQEVFYSHPAL